MPPIENSSNPSIHPSRSRVRVKKSCRLQCHSRNAGQSAERLHGEAKKQIQLFFPTEIRLRTQLTGAARTVSRREPVKPCEKTTLKRASSLRAPDSAYARCRPSRSRTLGAVTGGPPGAPHTLGGGGGGTHLPSAPATEHIRIGGPGRLAPLASSSIGIASGRASNAARRGEGECQPVAMARRVNWGGVPGRGT